MEPLNDFDFRFIHHNECLAASQNLKLLVKLHFDWFNYVVKLSVSYAKCLWQVAGRGGGRICLKKSNTNPIRATNSNRPLLRQKFDSIIMWSRVHKSMYDERILNKFNINSFCCCKYCKCNFLSLGQDQTL